MHREGTFSTLHVLLLVLLYVLVQVFKRREKIANLHLKAPKEDNMRHFNVHKPEPNEFIFFSYCLLLSSCHKELLPILPIKPLSTSVICYITPCTCTVFFC